MSIKFFFPGAVLMLIAPVCFSQLAWNNVDSLFGDMPASMHVYKSTSAIDGKANIAYYVSADLKDLSLEFTAEAEDRKRLTPSQYYQQNQFPLLVVNCTFFDVSTGQNLNTVIKNNIPLSFNVGSFRGTGKDSMAQYRTFRSAIGINAQREADVAWLKTDSVSKKVEASQRVIGPKIAPVACCARSRKFYRNQKKSEKRLARNFNSWNMVTAVGGGPVLVQGGDTLITNNEEKMFGGKGRYDKHPRTAMGYTRDGKLIVLVIQGRFPGVAEGADFTQESLILKDLGCYEALNLDGGGSSCMLVNGKETIKPSDKTGQRAVPAVFMIK